MNIIISSTFIMTEHLDNCRKTGPQSHIYINCDFIVWSVAEIERLISMSNYVPAYNRKSMTPQLFEAILFLKLNERFWNSNAVSESIYRAHSRNSMYWIESHELHEEQ